MGMTRPEIKRRLEEIVEFSGCAKYIDTPVKRYSSGMTVRLGFAVAAHLDCEILVIDEVLAVGDWNFQKQCIDKMQEISTSGRTLLFVSHNMSSVRQLCAKSVVMKNGSVETLGETSDMIKHYMADASLECEGVEKIYSPTAGKPFQVLRAHLCGADHLPRQKFSCGEDVTLVLQCESRRPVPGLYGFLDVSRSDGTSMIISDSFDGGENPLDDLPIGQHQLSIVIPRRVLGHGRYHISANFTSTFEQAFNVDSPGMVAAFELTDEETRRGNSRAGLLSVAPAWVTRKLTSGGVSAAMPPSMKGT
jgi:lipopolysaccharide transport system ATP-binding protein